MAKSTQKSRTTTKSTKVVARAKPAAKAAAKPKAATKPVKKVAAKAAVKSKPAAAAAAKSKAKVVSKKALAPKKPVVTSKAKKPAAPVKAAKARVPASKAVVRKVAAKKLPVKAAAPLKAGKARKPDPISPRKTKSSVIETNIASAAAAKPDNKSKAKAKTVSTTKLKGVTMQDGRYALPTNTVVHLASGYRPSPKEEYMNPMHLEYFRRKLQSWREDLVEESKQTIENLRDEVRDVGDEAERATRETENSLELRTRDRYRKLISKIDKALKRIEEGRYGFCEETDEDIGLDRLDARPIATLCLDAQERWEHRQKQMGD